MELNTSMGALLSIGHESLCVFESLLLICEWVDYGNSVGSFIRIRLLCFPGVVFVSIVTQTTLWGPSCAAFDQGDIRCMGGI